MLSKRENELLTRVGPGTPMGALMRQYWHPVAASQELDASPFRTKEVRVLGEDLVLNCVSQHNDEPSPPATPPISSTQRGQDVHCGPR